jgi:hypothetical protein
LRFSSVSTIVPAELACVNQERSVRVEALACQIGEFDQECRNGALKKEPWLLWARELHLFEGQFPS